MILTEEQKKMNVDWKSYERAKKALEDLRAPRTNKGQYTKGKKN